MRKINCAKNIKEQKVIIYGCGTMGKRVFTLLYDNYKMKVMAYTGSKRLRQKKYMVFQ